MAQTNSASPAREYLRGVQDERSRILEIVRDLEDVDERTNPQIAEYLEFEIERGKA